MNTIIISNRRVAEESNPVETVLKLAAMVIATIAFLAAVSAL